ncbi:MAG: S-layer homology domain-containing protein, partial [Oscillospiraceae bacterium]|nr:S-layer homology domain-containing protein [Oscillospiraceae bacterium]
GAIPDVRAGHPQAGAISLLYRAGVVQGSGGAHECAPDATITRCEVAAIIARMIDPSLRVRFDLTDRG